MPLKTLFLNPPSYEKFDGGASSRWPATREIESYWYPVWLTYPAGMLEGSRLVDAPPHHLKWPDVIEILKDYEFLVLFTSTMGWDGDQKLAEAIKRANPSIKIAFVGPPVTTSTDKALNECAAIDFVCRREFDFSIVEYAQGKPLSEILGVSYKDENGVIQHNPDRAQVTPEQLDEMPWATEIYARDLDVTKYTVPFLLHPFVALYSTRGCPAQCTFCLWPQTLSGHAWRKRSTDDVAAEMANAEKLKPLGLTWSCTSRVTTDYDTLKAMKEAGCRLLIVGYESGDPQILKNIKKGATIEMALRFTENCKKLGLVIHGDFIVGLPGETHESIRKTIDYAKRLDTETIQVSIAHPYPGTEFYDYAKKNNLISIDSMTDEVGHQLPTVIYPGLDKSELMEWVERFYGEYFFRPRVIWRIVRKAIFNTHDRQRLTKEAKEYMALRAKRRKYVADNKSPAKAASVAAGSGD